MKATYPDAITEYTYDNAWGQKGTYIFRGQKGTYIF
ncbi:MAG: hypothetical protein E7394_05300 [Ruminococcaceae bacterium]|nr:hypothetical protein [Oscillospiraceae bacterium]